MALYTNLPEEQKENARHGEAVFPIQKYTTVLTRRTPIVTAHWHEEAEFTLIREGSCICQMQLESRRAEVGDIVFIPPMQLHSVTKQTEQMVSDTFVFHMHFLGASSSDICTIRYLSPLMNQKLIPPFIIGKQHPAYPAAAELFNRINQAWETQPAGFELIVKSQLLALVALLIPYCQDDSVMTQTQTEHTRKIKLALEFIEMHYMENLTIGDVAAACYFSEYHFMRFFKKYIGMSCGEYIKNLKLEKAAELLESGGNTILDAALIVGFRNLSYFYREFKKKYGMTPKQFIGRNS